MRASEVLDMQGDLLTRFRDPFFEHVVRESFTSDHGAALAHMGVNEQTIRKNATYLTGTHANHVAAAYAYRVTPDMVDLLSHAAVSLNPEDEWDSGLAPTGCGIVRFDKPLLVSELRGRSMKVHWLVWGPASARDDRGRDVPVTLLTWYNDAADPDEVGLGAIEDDELSPEQKRRLGRWWWVGAEYVQNGRPVGSESIPVQDEVVEVIRHEGWEPAASVTNLSAYAHALWLMLGQTITVAEKEHVERPAARRARRMRIPAEVTVIRLRRTEHHGQHGETSVEWQHSWIVRGHWRWQVCGPHHPLAQETGPGRYRCRIWISPHVKGPEDAPLKQTDKLYSLDR